MIFKPLSPYRSCERILYLILETLSPHTSLVAPVYEPFKLPRCLVVRPRYGQALCIAARQAHLSCQRRFLAELRTLLQGYFVEVDEREAV